MAKTNAKVVHVGSTHYGSVFVEIEYTNGRLSISGVEGPTRGGNARGGAGQIIDTLDNLTTLAPGWTPEMVARLREVWDRWHLNDMHAGCEHQRELGWGKEKVTLVTMRLNNAGVNAERALKRRVNEEIADGVPVQLTPEELLVWNAKYEVVVPDGDDLNEDVLAQYGVTPALFQNYNIQGSEEKWSGWVRESEHPRGVLAKPCPVCGYKYGTAWLREEVPADVIDFLNSLPFSDIPYPWG